MNRKIENLFSLKGKTIIVTGASRGIGHKLADDLSGAGGDVFAVARSGEPDEPFSNPVRFASLDITGETELREFCENIYREKKSIDVLVNCAGIASWKKAADPLDKFDRIMEVNLRSVYRIIGIVQEFMQQKGGSIINVSSISALLGMPGNPEYAASKGGLSAMTRALAVDLAEYGIRVNSLAPGYILTDMTRDSFNEPELKELRDRRIILGRWGKPEDLTGAAILLASDASSYMTGTDLIVDGGWTVKGL